jgi:hypothetical protein
MNNKYKVFFYRYWWLYYLLFFLLVGLLIFILVTFNQSGTASRELKSLSDRLDSCDCHDNPPCPPNLPYNTIVPNPIDSTNNENSSYQAQDGCLSFTLSWSTLDDLDLRVIDPDGNNIWYKRYCRRSDNAFSTTGGQLDVDMNVINKLYNPIENIFFRCTNTTPKNGIYKVYVKRYDMTTRSSVPFVLKVKEKGLVKKEISQTLTQLMEEKLVISYRYSKNGN